MTSFESLPDELLELLTTLTKGLTTKVLLTCDMRVMHYIKFLKRFFVFTAVFTTATSFQRHCEPKMI